ncbi:MAG TPA: SdrD B-like domain-containing protein, partial [Anaerolineae bacterium]|nr:SdrD B-like domain-containing protein [Anaerolineae bacterium]
MTTRRHKPNLLLALLLALFTLAAPSAGASAPLHAPDNSHAPLAPATPSANLLVHFDAANIDGTGPQSGDICGRTDTTWVNLANPGTSNGTLGNFTLPCTPNAGWKGNGVVADPYRLHFDGRDISGQRVTVTSTAPRTINVWFYADAQAINSAYLYRLGTGGSHGTARLGYEGYLEVTYNNGAVYGTGIDHEAWHMLTVQNDGSTTRFYLDNVEFANEASTAAVGSSVGYLGASSSLGQAGWNGSIANFRLYNDALTRSEISILYQQERYRFQADPGALRIDRIQNAFGTTAGGETVTIYGQHFQTPVAVTFGGIPATGVTLLDEGRLSTVVPAHALGPVDVVVTSDATGSQTVPGAYRYTDLPSDNMEIWFNASNIDSVGARGYGVSTDRWTNLTYGSDGGLVGIDQPATANEGWKGDGSAEDPYRLEAADEGNYSYHDMVVFHTHRARSVNIWYHDHGNDWSWLFSIWTPGVGNYTFFQLRGNLLQATYNDLWAGNTVAASVTRRQSHMVTLVNDGTTTTFYLDGFAFATQPGSTLPPTETRIGPPRDCEDGYDGAVCDVRVYRDSLTAEEVMALYEEGGYCQDANRPVSVGSLVWLDEDGDGQQDVGEPSIAGATVRLLNEGLSPVFDADGRPVPALVTGINGLYHFGNLRPGRYLVEVIPPAGSRYVATVLAADPNPDSNPSNSDSNGEAVTYNGSGLALRPDPAVRFIDNDNDSDPIFTASGFTYSTMLGFQGDIHYTRGDATGDRATWQFQDLVPGRYRVSTTYLRGSSRATNAPYTLSGIEGGPGVVQINQQVAPSDFTDQGVGWEDLGWFDILEGSLRVQLDDNANGYVYADAVRIEYVEAVSSNAVRSPAFTLARSAEPTDEVFADSAPDQDGRRDDDGNMTIDFGFVQPAAIGNFVWVDENSDGYQDAGEPGIPNVRILLKDSAGNVLFETRTDSHGGYLFSGLQPGSY